MTKTKIEIQESFKANVSKLRPDWPADYIESIILDVLEVNKLDHDAADLEDIEGALDEYIADLENYLSEKEEFLSDNPTLAELIEDLEVSMTEPAALPDSMKWIVNVSEVGSLADAVRDFTNAAWDLKKKLRQLCTGYAQKTDQEINQIIKELL